jgi:hypothetical protein
MNITRIITGGLVAGLVLNIIDFVVNALLLGEQWASAMQARGIDPMSVPLGGTGWIFVDFVTGISLVWLYAAIQPRFGATVKTAMIASSVIWLITRAVSSSLWFTGGFPLELIVLSSLGTIVATVAAALAGRALYKER